MSAASDRPTRVANDLLAAAAEEGAREGRSAKQQLEHWARVGRAVSSTHTAARRRVEAAMDGRLELAELDAAEQATYLGEMNARLEERLLAGDLGNLLAARNITTVAIDEHGQLTEYRPDGTTSAL